MLVCTSSSQVEASAKGLGHTLFQTSWIQKDFAMIEWQEPVNHVTVRMPSIFISCTLEVPRQVERNKVKQI